jgi:hypothetical protein
MLIPSLFELDDSIKLECAVTWQLVTHKIPGGWRRRIRM